MQVNHIKLYKSELEQQAWESYLALDHAIHVEDNDDSEQYIVFYTIGINDVQSKDLV